ncbi:hypothetical protein Droror1_Dr00021252 [Drosera rotundifolia]
MKPPKQHSPPPLPSPPPPPMDESPLSPLRSDQPDRTKPSTASLEKYYSPLASPLPGSPTAATSHVINLGRVVAARGGERGVVEEMVVRRERKEERVRSVGVVIRVCEVVLCLISFSVLAADRTQGWSGDSFDRYKEYRFCLSINVIGVVYAGFQALDQAYHLASGKHLVMHHLRHHFDFVIDQASAGISSDIGIICSGHKGCRLGVELGKGCLHREG